MSLSKANRALGRRSERRRKKNEQKVFLIVILGNEIGILPLVAGSLWATEVPIGSAVKLGVEGLVTMNASELESSILGDQACDVGDEKGSKSL
jgi:hypothetical protein